MTYGHVKLIIHLFKIHSQINTIQGGRGNDYKRLRTKPGPQPHPIPDDVHAYIRDSLHENRFLSTKERCQIINERFGFPIPRRQVIVYLL